MNRNERELCTGGDSVVKVFDSCEVSFGERKMTEADVKLR